MGNFIYNQRYKGTVSEIEAKASLVGDSELILAKQDEKIAFKNADGNIVTVSTDGSIEGIVDAKIAEFFDGVGYDSDEKVINFYHGRTIKATIDATPFLVDGMIDEVKIEDGKLVIVFNTDAGKETIEIPLTEIFDPANYYTKAEVDALLLEKENEIYKLTTIVGDMGGAVTYEYPNAAGKSLTTLLGNNGTVKLTEDATISRFGPGIMAKNKVTLNLNGHSITATSAGSQGAIMARGTMEVTITGNSATSINAVSGVCIEANGNSVVINLSGKTTYVTDRSGAELIYCYAGTINIKGGTFKNLGEDKRYMLNCYDANYRAGLAKIIVTGGSFYDFNPADNSAEGEHTSFVPEGYHVEVSTDGDSTVYTVKAD